MKDNEIRNEIINQLAWDTRINAPDVKVDVDEKTVTLKGDVSSFYESRVINEEVKNIEGVSKIINKLEIRNPSKKRPSDDQVEQDVKDALRLDSVIDESKIDIQVNRGVVFLKGSVDAYWKKLEAEGIISRINGVLGVTNELAITLTEKSEDKEIADKLVNYVKKNVLAKVDDVNVSVDDGHVILAGCVPNWQAQYAIRDYAKFIKGVKSVVSTIKVTYSDC